MPKRSLHEQIDSVLERDWAVKKITPAPPASDAEFVRRAYLDLCGMIPSAAQTKEFLDDMSSDKHSRLIDRLLASPEHALALARVLDVMLIERRTHTVTSYDVAKAAWRNYLAASVAENKPWDQLVRELLSSDGTDEPRAAATKFFISRDAAPHQLTRDVGRLLLGVDLQCAQCHDDPRIEEYRQADYYGLYAFLSRTTFFRDGKANKSLIGETAVGDVTFTSVFTAK
ncbi:MAG TPA: DUF1549 domain-containing protein, partial [Pirellulaceae bacterium]|nr:DUF1549 domain-containing protein [Pirellulaceae bacterium]